jgi:regulator of sigma E protease
MMLSLSFLIAYALGVAVHELGHLVAARHFGVAVLSLSFGLGPEIMGITDRYGTRWRLALLPLGGSCSLYDDGTAAQPPVRGLSDLPPLQKAVFYAAGSLFNIIFAFGVLLVAIVKNGQMSLLTITGEQPALALLISGVSFSLGLFNLAPLLPLDGGRLTIAAIEACVGSPRSRKIERRLASIGPLILTCLSIILAAFVLRTYVLSISP